MDLRGLENLGQYGNELSITNNNKLSSLVHLSANLPSQHRISLRNIGIHNNPVLRDVAGLRIIENVTGVFIIIIYYFWYQYGM